MIYEEWEEGKTCAQRFVLNSKSGNVASEPNHCVKANSLNYRLQLKWFNYSAFMLTWRKYFNCFLRKNVSFKILVNTAYTQILQGIKYVNFISKPGWVLLENKETEMLSRTPTF